MGEAKLGTLVRLYNWELALEIHVYNHNNTLDASLMIWMSFFLEKEL